MTVNLCINTGTHDASVTIMKDGKLLPIEMTVKVKFDPNTQKLEVIT